MTCSTMTDDSVKGKRLDVGDGIGDGLAVARSGHGVGGHFRLGMNGIYCMKNEIEYIV